MLELLADIAKAERDAPVASLQTEWASLSPEEKRTRLTEVKYRILELEEELSSAAPARLAPMQAPGLERNSLRRVNETESDSRVLHAT